MSTSTRTDIHRPSAIEPADYVFVACGCMKIESLEDAAAVAENRRIFAAHMAATGGKVSEHQHGGNCHVCGAHCIYTTIFHHEPTNTYVYVGSECAEKIDAQAARQFWTFKSKIDDARKLNAGKSKAKAILGDAGLTRAFELYESLKDRRGSVRGAEPLVDIVTKVIRYGTVSDSQLSYLRKLAYQIDNSAKVAADREALLAAERAAAQDCPAGRMVVTGEVVSTKAEEGMYGVQLRMLVKDDRGFKVFGTIPSDLQYFDTGLEGELPFQRSLTRGDRVTFTATLKPSSDDAKFGFFSRPAKAECSTKSDAALAASWAKRRD